MLGKLFKYEMKAVSRVLIPIHMALAVVTLIGRLYVQVLYQPWYFEEPWSKFIETVTVFFIFLYIVLLAAASIMTQVYLMVLRPHKNLFGDEGYLMHTLPVSVYQHITTKTLVTVLWMILDSILVCLSIFTLIINQDLWRELTEMLPQIPGLLREIGLSPSWVTILLLLTLLISSAQQALMALAAMTIGHSFNKHKILYSFLIYGGMYMAISMLNLSFTSILPGLEDTSQIYLFFYANLMTSTVISAASFFLTSSFLKNNLNLE